MGGTPLAKSCLYTIFTNPFYCGWMQRSEGLFQGRHQPMITKDEFDCAQVILGKRGRPRPKQKHFAFTGMIRCGECNALITAEDKINRYGYHYTYYHCTKRKPYIKCSQKSLELAGLEKQISAYLSTITISDTFRDYALKYLQEVHKSEVMDRGEIQKTQQRTYKQCVAAMDNLTGMRLRNLLTDEEFLHQKNQLLMERGQLKERIEDMDHRIDKWMDLTEKAFIFANRAKYWFEHGSLEDKKMILEVIGSNLILKDKKLFIEAKKPFLIIKKGLEGMVQKNLLFEPQNIGSVKGNIASPQPQYSYLCALVNEVRTFFENYLLDDNSKTAHEHFYIPDLRDKYAEAA
jgi:hypothetical protein